MKKIKRQLKSRRQSKWLISKILKSSFIKFVLSFMFSYYIAYVPTYSGLSFEATNMLFILLFSASLWITEAISAFAVSFLLISLEVMLLGFPNFDFSTGSKEWVYFLKPWSSPLVFLFIAGFILAIAASKTKLDLWLAKKVLFYCGSKPRNVLIGLMLVTFFFSMFISNTATTAMMLTMLLPIIKNMKKNNPFQKGLLLAIVVSANIGGMGTIIGTPPNAIAVGILGENAPTFTGWMTLATPPAILLATILGFIIYKIYPSTEENIQMDKIRNVVHFDDSTSRFTKVPTIPSWKKVTVILVFMATISLWLTEPFHHIPTTVVSLLPIVLFTLFNIIGADDIKEIRWDVIILIIGGLSLGGGVMHTGLDTWLSTQFQLEGLSILTIAIIFIAFVVIISNFMSNTAATNIILPLVVALVSSMGQGVVSYLVISIALGASCAMLLPVSTPPNAIAFSSGKLKSKDFLIVGAITALIGPAIVLTYLNCCMN